ncbi:MAG: MdtA/MuxA family multidrug efflux RND transporter periplasmic adaptor subunit [Planctomycetota bacterium]|nr:MdtA/MuxA family multidrug efflux RND transporter periplasmic adaptor subunit [Planctomycetota bacterium]
MNQPASPPPPAAKTPPPPPESSPESPVETPSHAETPHKRPARDHAPAPHHKGTWWFPIVVTLLLVLAGYGLYRWLGHPVAAPGPGGGRGSRPVTINAATAKQGDLPVYLNALGTVTAFNTVTIRSRVDGQLDLVNFTEGKTVKAGEVLVKIDPRPYEAMLHQAQGQLARDQASLDNARRDLDRYVGAGDAASQQQRDTALAAVGQFEAAVKVDNAQIESARLQVEYCTIKAPLTGRIGLRTVDQGNMVHASDAAGLAVITQVDPISVLFSLPQDNLPQVMHAIAGNDALPVEAFSRDLRTKLATGELKAVDNQIDPNTASVRFKAKFDNPGQVLFPNQFVNVRLLVDTRRAAVLVPSAAVQRSPQAKFVYVVDAEDTVSMQPVKEGPAEGEFTVIEEGLRAGQEVVTDGADKLIPGMKIVRQSAATQAATQSGAGAGTGGRRHKDSTGGTDSNRGPR